jgi:hypothetical protein
MEEGESRKVSRFAVRQVFFRSDGSTVIRDYVQEFVEFFKAVKINGGKKNSSRNEGWFIPNRWNLVRDIWAAYDD